jgi:hypothetical protein
MRPTKGVIMDINSLKLLTEVLVLERELDEGQSMIDHGRKTILGIFPPVKAYLNRRQLDVDVQRIRVNAAKKYLESQEENS